MKHWAVWAPRAALAGLLLLSAGCLRPPPPTHDQFNNQFYKWNKKLYTVSREFRDALGVTVVRPETLSADQQAALRAPDVARAKETRDKAREVLDEITAEFNTARVPLRPGEHAQPMRDAYEDFLKVEEEIIDKDYAEIIAVLANNETFPSVDQKRAAIGDILDRIDAKEAKPMGKFLEEQAEYCKIFNLRMVGPRGTAAGRGNFGGAGTGD